MVDKAKHYAEDIIEISAKKKLRYSAYHRCIVAWFFVGDVSNSPVCIGGYSCLLWSFNCGVSVVICLICLIENKFLNSCAWPP